MSDTNRLKLLLAGFCWLCICSAHAEIPETLVTCQAMIDAQTRLACYDTAMEQLLASETAAEMSVERKSVSAEVSTTTSSATTLSAADLFGRDEAAARDLVAEATGTAKLESVEADITALQKAVYGEHIIELDNGQKWRQIDSRSLRLKVGERVRISAASMGSFLLEKSSGSQKIRVRRLD